MSGTPSTVTRGVSSSVAERRARALSKPADKSATKTRRGGGGRSPKSGGTPNEVVANTFGLLWIITGGLIILVCLGFVVASIAMFGVLQDISATRNFGGLQKRVDALEQRFSEIATAGFEVEYDKPNINEGVTQYLWTVQPPNDGPLRVFSWQHYLESNEMRPTSNSAALMDVELGNITLRQAEEYSRRDKGGQVYQWNANDEVARAIIQHNVVPFARNSNSGWGPNLVAENLEPLPPPLIDPKARTRKGVGTSTASEEEEEEEDAAAEEGAEGEPPGDTQTQPPAEKQPEAPEPEPPIEVEPEPPADDPGDDGGSEPEPQPEPEPGDGESTPVF
jgi:hypothetical protein